MDRKKIKKKSIPRGKFNGNGGTKGTAYITKSKKTLGDVKREIRDRKFEAKHPTGVIYA